MTEINTAADAARALEPLVHDFPNAGFVAKLVFSVGIIGLGLLAVPVLAGSSSYAISEALGWREGLHRKFRNARGFYIIIMLATLVGLGMNFVGLDPIKALIFTAVFNGIAAVPLLFVIAKIGNNEHIMGEYKNGHLSNFFVRLACAVMALAALVLLYSFFRASQSRYRHGLHAAQERLGEGPYLPFMASLERKGNRNECRSGPSHGSLGEQGMAL